MLLSLAHPTFLGQALVGMWMQHASDSLGSPRKFWFQSFVRDIAALVCRMLAESKKPTCTKEKATQRQAAALNAITEAALVALVEKVRS